MGAKDNFRWGTARSPHPYLPTHCFVGLADSINEQKQNGDVKPLKFALCTANTKGYEESIQIPYITVRFSLCSSKV